VKDDDFIAALEHIDKAGGMPGREDAPATYVMLERAKRENAVAWDDDRWRYVLTGTGRQKIASRRARDSGAVREPTTAEIRPFRRKPDAAAR
jgi:hypothetical protein